MAQRCLHKHKSDIASPSVASENSNASYSRAAPRKNWTKIKAPRPLRKQANSADQLLFRSGTTPPPGKAGWCSLLLGANQEAEPRVLSDADTPSSAILAQPLRTEVNSAMDITSNQESMFKSTSQGALKPNKTCVYNSVSSSL